MASFRVAFFSTQGHDRIFFSEEGKGERYGQISLHFYETALHVDTVELAKGFHAVCVFVNDDVNATVLDGLKKLGVSIVALRCSGYNAVDLAAAKSLGLTVTHVPSYSPYSVAEHAVALLMTLNRKTHKVYNRMRESDFSLERLGAGFDIHGKTVGVVGTGKIGQSFAKIMNGFGARLLAYDLYPTEALAGIVNYVDLTTLLRESDVISLHCPLTPQTKHLINKEALAHVKPGVVLLNTSRGGLVDTKAVIAALKAKKIAGLGIDTYEEEADHFYMDRSEDVVQDDVLMRLLTFNNVLVTPHQGFFTSDAIGQIANYTMTSILDHVESRTPLNYLVYQGELRPGLK